jgi:hypothetical protein
MILRVITGTYMKFQLCCYHLTIRILFVMVINKNYEVRVVSNDARFMPNFSKIQRLFQS